MTASDKKRVANNSQLLYTFCMAHARVTNYREELTTAGLKQTKARLAVLDILRKEQRPLDVLELLLCLEEEKIAVDQATIYRILDIFLRKEFIRRLEFQEGKFRYELVGDEHHHLICERCGKIQDITDCAIDELENDIMKKKGFRVKRHSLEFFGLCRDCNKK